MKFAIDRLRFGAGMPCDRNHQRRVAADDCGPPLAK
jgi:hypothetical protein